MDDQIDEEMKDFIVDDGYRHNEDPDYIPEETPEDDDDKYVVKGKEFKKLIKKAQKLGAETFDYSKRKNSKYVVKLPSGKKIHFGSTSFSDFLIHRDEDRRSNYLARAKKIKNKKNNFWSINLLWNK